MFIIKVILREFGEMKCLLKRKKKITKCVFAKLFVLFGFEQFFYFLGCRKAFKNTKRTV